jgi:hypothetical protein
VPGGAALTPLRLYRVLIAIQIGLTALGVLAASRLERTLPAPLRDYLLARADAPVRTIDVAVLSGGMILLAAFVTSWLGLLLFWRLGRWLFLGASGGALVLELAGGPTVATAIETTLSTAVATIGGAIIGLAFFSSDVAGRFETGARRAP